MGVADHVVGASGGVMAELGLEVLDMIRLWWWLVVGGRGRRGGEEDRRWRRRRRRAHPTHP